MYNISVFEIIVKNMVTNCVETQSIVATDVWYIEPVQFLSESEMVQYLVSNIDDHIKQDIIATPFNELIKYRQTLGAWIQNNFGLWNIRNPITSLVIGVRHPDETSMRVIEEMWSIFKPKGGHIVRLI